MGSCAKVQRKGWQLFSTVWVNSKPKGKIKNMTTEEKDVDEVDKPWIQGKGNE